METQSQSFFENTVNNCLPATVNFNDLKNFTRLLKRKPEGFSVTEVTDAFLRRLFEPYKLSAYEELDLITTKNNLVTMKPLGLELAKCGDEEAKVYRKILIQLSSYRETLKWISNQEKSLFCYTELVDFWKEKFPDLISNPDEKTSEGIALSFFNLCHFAELGLAIVGRKGQQTRLNVDQNQLRNFLNEQTGNNFSQNLTDSNNQNSQNGNFQKNFDSHNNKPTKIFISANEMSETVSSVKSLLELSETDWEVNIRSESLLSEKTIQTMRQCSAAVIIADKQGQVLCNGNFRVNDGLLSEIVAAFAMFESRVLLLWQGENVPYIPLNGLKILCLKNKNPEWKTGLEIAQILKEFKKH